MASMTHAGKHGVCVVTLLAALVLADGAEEIGARVYGSHFDEPELKALAEFQRSAVGRKAARLTPAIARETARAIEGEIAQSHALPRLIEELGREFPVLRGPETP